MSLGNETIIVGSKILFFQKITTGLTPIKSQINKVQI
jgi:hypothetical protein